MRKFTKDHNDLDWLFPSNYVFENSEHFFDFYERIAQYYKEVYCEDKKTFTVDEMIDSFMKGCSIAHRTMYINYISKFKNLDDLKKHIEAIKFADNHLKETWEKLNSDLIKNDNKNKLKK